MPGAGDNDYRAYRPGQMVPISGVYTVVHEGHRAEHEALAIRGDEFPFCRVCQGEVRFYVAQIVPYITHDFDLAGPAFRFRKQRGKAAGG